MGEPAFCCAGCEAVYGALAEHGLQRYYELREDARPEGPAATTTRAYEELDDPALVGTLLHLHANRTATIEFYLEGVHCAACVWVLERLPTIAPGVRTARIDIRRRIAKIEFLPAEVALSEIARILCSLGYPPHVWRRGDQDALRRSENRRHLIRIGVAGACAGNAMLLAFGLWGGAFHGIAGDQQQLLRGASLLFCAAAVFGPGAVFLRGAWSSLRMRVLHMDVPVAIGLVTGTLYGAWNTVRGTGEVYFESLTAVVFLLLLGRYLQFLQRQSAEDSISLLFTAVPGTARRLEGTSQREVPIEALRPNDRVVVGVGDTVPADGVIERGSSSFDLSLLTGESRPVARGEGERVHAGCANLGGPVTVRIEQTGTDTRLGRLLSLVLRFASERPPIVRLADRVAHVFVLIVLALAAATLMFWWATSPAQAIENAVALLIVTCPCALGLATPLAIQAAIGKAARAGILIRRPDVLEQLTSGGQVFLDKTGTLTKGRLTATLVSGDANALHLAAAAEENISHPAARAIVDAARASDPARPLEVATDVRYEAGRGVTASIQGRTVRVGTREWIDRRGGQVGEAHLAGFTAALDRGASPVVISLDEEVIGVLALDDAVRPDSATAISALRKLGFAPTLLSGDHREVAARVAVDVGIEPDHVEGGATPERKAERVRDSLALGTTTIMVGDGMNDAAALSAASVGVAVKGGAEASLAAADVYLAREGLLPLLQLIEGGRRTVSVIRRGIAASLAYNVVSGSLAILGIIHPLTAALLMPISSLTVVFVAFRSRTFVAG